MKICADQVGDVEHSPNICMFQRILKLGNLFWIFSLLPVKQRHAILALDKNSNKFVNSK